MNASSAENRSALALGVTGLVGAKLLELLLQDAAYSRVKVLTRRPLGVQHEKLTVRIVDFDRLSAVEPEFFAVNDVFCALGTTIAQAGSQAAFRKVDFDYPLEVAKVALSQGAEQYFLVSAIGADPRSAVFYSRVKGEIEEAVAALGYPSFAAFQPSFLLGKREQTRFGEEFGIALASVLKPLMLGPLAKYRAVSAEAVAGAMIAEAKKRETGRRTVESDRIQEIFDRLQRL
jgi:uncharacterized protein YbjT (DUF2867 family)